MFCIDVIFERISKALFESRQLGFGICVLIWTLQSHQPGVSKQSSVSFMSNYANNTPCELTLTSKATPLSTENGWWINAPFCLLLASLPAGTQCWFFVTFDSKFICAIYLEIHIQSWVLSFREISDYFMDSTKTLNVRFRFRFRFGFRFRFLLISL